MLTIAYCRVSTEEQAAEGFSIEGQADKLRAYADFRDLREVTVISDPGLSGKNVERPGLQQILAAVRAGHVSHIIVWRLDRLSRSLSDLILLADLFGSHDVALHSVSENLDLSNAAGRMFYNILGTFAQYFREQLSENIKMGNARAIAEGRYINRPKTGYNLVDGLLVPNDDALRVREVFRLRILGHKYQDISDRTGFTYSLVQEILKSRVYLGEMARHGGWVPGRHESIITEAEWNLVNAGRIPGKRTSGDLLASHVRCGLCLKRMSVQQNGDRRVLYRCRSRGSGCNQPSRTNTGLLRAAVMGIGEVTSNDVLQDEIRRHLSGVARRTPATASRARPKSAGDSLAELDRNRRKLLDLFYNDKIDPDFFHQEEQRIKQAIEAARAQGEVEAQRTKSQDELLAQFESVLEVLHNLDIEAFWEEAEHNERRILIQQFVEWVTVYPNHLEVTLKGAPALYVNLATVGLKESENIGVGRPVQRFWYKSVASGPRRRSGVTGVWAQPFRCLQGRRGLGAGPQ